MEAPLDGPVARVAYKGHTRINYLQGTYTRAQLSNGDGISGLGD
jgi:hypothetical protein